MGRIGSIRRLGTQQIPDDEKTTYQDQSDYSQSVARIRRYARRQVTGSNQDDPSSREFETRRQGSKARLQGYSLQVGDFAGMTASVSSQFEQFRRS